MSLLYSDFLTVAFKYKIIILSYKATLPLLQNYSNHYNTLTCTSKILGMSVEATVSKSRHLMKIAQPRLCINL